MNYKTMPRKELIAELEAWEGKLQKEVRKTVRAKVKEHKAAYQAALREVNTLLVTYDITTLAMEAETIKYRLHYQVSEGETLLDACFVSAFWGPRRYSKNRKEIEVALEHAQAAVDNLTNLIAKG